ncbi:uncharacterized protein LOC100905214 [Galendromus occidentalis]|uniref:Uncharacterized protein LOC100905214 n=1 Tax=Galendromus occidentalis TaxID=34638 RepID=A0AAJ6VVA3_9ACAR|nr:uncharacterized protein LOC100905214 [Galendromus occidentalis]
MLAALLIPLAWICHTACAAPIVTQPSEYVDGLLKSLKDELTEAKRNHLILKTPREFTHHNETTKKTIEVSVFRAYVDGMGTLERADNCSVTRPSKDSKETIECLLISPSATLTALSHIKGETDPMVKYQASMHKKMFVVTIERNPDGTAQLEDFRSSPLALTHLDTAIARKMSSQILSQVRDWVDGGISESIGSIKETLSEIVERSKSPGVEQMSQSPVEAESQGV